MAKELKDEKRYSQCVPPITHPDLWIPTGSVALDASLGRGYPRARITHIIGPSQSRKTTLMLSMIAQAQKITTPKSIRACYFSGEDGLLEEIALYFGVDLNELRYKELDTIEEYFNKISSFSRKCAEDNVHGAAFLDSMSSLSTNSEKYAQGGVGHDFMYNPHSRKISQGWRAVRGALTQNRTTSVIIDHEKPTGVPGGAATAFYSHLQLKMIGQYPIREGGQPDGKEIGYRTDVHVTKNRFSTKAVIPFRFYYRPNPIIEYQDWWEFLKMQDLAKVAGSWYSLKPFFDKSFYEKDFKELFYANRAKFDEILQVHYEKRYKEYCELRKMDPSKQFEEYMKSLEEDAAQAKKEAEEDPSTVDVLASGNVDLNDTSAAERAKRL